MNFLKLASLEGSPETVDSTPVHISLVLVTSPMNLVEIAKREPTSPRGGLVTKQFGKEIILPSGVRRSIDRCNLEITIDVGIERVDVRRKTKLSNLSIRDMHDGSIPKEEDATPGAICRPLQETFKAITSQVASIELGDGG